MIMVVMRCTATLCFLSLVALACSEAPPIVLPEGDDAGGSGATSGSGGTPTSSIISASVYSVMETDPQITVSDQGVVCAVWSALTSDAAGEGTLEGGEGSHIGYAFSEDGGSTWTVPARLSSPDGELYGSPDVISDSSGQFSLSFLSHRRGIEGARLLVAETSGGTTFDAPVVVTDERAVGFYGRPRIAVTNSGRLLLPHTILVDGIAQLAVASRKQGQMWERNVLSEDNAHHAFPYPCAAQLTLSGGSYLAFLRAGRVLLARSEDNGDTWESIEVQQDGEQGVVTGPPSCVATGNHVWVSYGIRGQGALSAIHVAHSRDAGETIEGWLTVSDGDVGNQFALHELAVERPEDVGHVAYYAAAGIGDESASLHRGRFTSDEFLPLPSGEPPLSLDSVLVREPVAFELASTNTAWLGESVGVAFGGGALHIAYVDNSDGTAHVAAEKLVVSD